MPAPHHSVFYGPDGEADANQERQSTEGAAESVLISTYDNAVTVDSDSVLCIILRTKLPFH